MSIPFWEFDMQQVIPKTFLIGMTRLNHDGLKKYLSHVQCEDFYDQMIQEQDSIALSSMYAKLCYKALKVGDNPNVTRVRLIPDNIKGCFDAGHGSVFEHCWFNFVTTDCSRILTHELCRHRVGVAFSQTSGRFVRLDDNLEMIIDPILKDVVSILQDACTNIESSYHLAEEILFKDKNMDFNLKKKLTSALRRILPNGQANEMGWSANIRALRHMILMRTSRHAEWEIRLVFNQVYQLIKEVDPLLLYGAKEEDVEGLLEITGMKTQPYA